MKEYVVYFDATGAGRGPEAIGGPFSTYKDAEDWVVEFNYVDDSNVFIDDAKFAYEN